MCAFGLSSQAPAAGEAPGQGLWLLLTGGEVIIRGEVIIT